MLGVLAEVQQVFLIFRVVSGLLVIFAREFLDGRNGCPKSHGEELDIVTQILAQQIDALVTLDFSVLGKACLVEISHILRFEVLAHLASPHPHNHRLSAKVC